MSQAWVEKPELKSEKKFDFFIQPQSNFILLTWKRLVIWQKQLKVN